MAECKLCTNPYHLNCLFSTGEVCINSSMIICADCKMKKTSENFQMKYNGLNISPNLNNLGNYGNMNTMNTLNSLGLGMNNMNTNMNNNMNNGLNSNNFSNLLFSKPEYFSQYLSTFNNLMKANNLNTMSNLTNSINSNPLLSGTQNTANTNNQTNNAFSMFSNLLPLNNNNVNDPGMNLNAMNTNNNSNLQNMIPKTTLPNQKILDHLNNLFPKKKNNMTVNDNNLNSLNNTITNTLNNTLNSSSVNNNFNNSLNTAFTNLQNTSQTNSNLNNMNPQQLNVLIQLLKNNEKAKNPNILQALLNSNNKTSTLETPSLNNQTNNSTSTPNPNLINLLQLLNNTTNKNSSLIKIDNKQNNVTNVNFFNNLINIPVNSFSNVNSSLNSSNANKYINKANLTNSGLKDSLIKDDYQKFPIEDFLLYKNTEKYEINTECYKRPEYKYINIPNEYISNIIQMWDYLFTFKNFINLNLELSKINNIENFYQTLITDTDFTTKIFISLIQTFIGEMNQTENVEKELFMIKTTFENVINSPQDILQICWLDILCLIISCKKFGLLFSEELKSIQNKIKSECITPLNYKGKLSMDEIFNLLLFLINSSFDLPKLKDLIKTETEKKSNLLKDKSILEMELRNKENRKKEIEKSDKFAQAPARIENITSNLKKYEENYNKGTMTQALNKQKKELETEREKYKSVK